MPQQNSNGNAVELKALDALIERLSVEVDAAKTNSNDFYSKASRLAAFSLNCDCEKGEARPEQPEGLLTTLNDLINKLQYVNRRNLEILLQVDKIM
jgi:hypothetical protein